MTDSDKHSSLLHLELIKTEKKFCDTGKVFFIQMCSIWSGWCDPSGFSYVPRDFIKKKF